MTTTKQKRRVIITQNKKNTKLDIIISILSIYIFILLGYAAKFKLKEQLQEKSLVIISIYFLQPMFVLWGLNTQSLELIFLKIPFIYLLVATGAIIISFVWAKYFFDDTKERSIVTITTVIGNTGGLGIPLGIALLGEKSVIYLSLINVASIFLMYTAGIYFYSRGTFSIKESLFNIVKLPVIWFSALALLINFSNITIHPSLFKSLEMGAYTAMVLQLMIFGMYLYSVKLRNINLKLLLHVGVVKYFVIPLVLILLLPNIGLDKFSIELIILALIVPLATANVNLSSLYDCNPLDVTTLVFVSSIFFVPYIVAIMYYIDKG